MRYPFAMLKIKLALSAVVWGLLACSPASVATSSKAAAPEIPYQAPDEHGWGSAGTLRYLEYIAGDASPEQALPLLVMIHGMGDRPARSWLQGLDVGKPIRVIMPEAPQAYGPGFSWFEYRIGEDNPPERLAAGIASAREQLATAIEVLTRRRPSLGLPVVCGFSQGGILSYALALDQPSAMRLALPIAGMLPAPLWPMTRAKQARSPMIRALHGERDEIVPTDHDRRLVKRLSDLGYDVQLTTYPDVGHAISAAMQAEINAQLQAAFR